MGASNNRPLAWWRCPIPGNPKKRRSGWNKMVKKATTSQILKKRALKQQRGPWARIIKWSLWAVVFLMFVAVSATVGFFLYLGRDLPKISTLRDYHPPIITTVYSDDNRVMAEFFKERRIVLPLEQIPVHLQNAFSPPRMHVFTSIREST
jgi:penicillin-binding protein 1A